MQTSVKMSLESAMKPSPKLLRYFFFAVGIIATIAYRIIPFLDPLLVKIAWYIGTAGFTIYFWHRAYIETKRANMVKDYDLVQVIEKSDIIGDQKSALAYLTKTSLTSKGRYNSAFISILSAVVLVISAVIDAYYIFSL